MKSVLSVVLVTLALSGKGIDFNFDDILPLEKSVELAERGDAQGLYSLAINCAKGSTSREGDRGNLEWMRGSVWKLLTQAEDAGSADASLLLGALYERRFYTDTLGVGRASPQWVQGCEYFDGKIKAELPMSSMAAIETEILTNRLFAGISPLETQRVQPQQGLRLARQPRWTPPEKSVVVRHPDTKFVYRYKPSGLTNELEKGLIRAQYLKAREVGHPLADVALCRFETNCVRMAAIVDAILPNKDEGDYRWTFEVANGEAMIVAGGKSNSCTIRPLPEGKVVIPQVLGGVKVTRIGVGAFRNCRGMTEVVIPAGVKEIRWGAFSGCISLGVVSIPSSVTKIDPNAFSECEGLTSFTVSAENTHYVSHNGTLFDKDMKTLVCYPVGIGGAYEIPSGVTAIGDSAFSGCGDLTSVSVPDSVTRIGEFAFSRCEKLTSAALGSGVGNLGRAPFYGCSELTSITVNEANGRYASRDGVLFDRDMRTVICCPGGLKGDYIIPSGVTTIGSYAFDSCRKLTSVTIPTSVTRINENAFNYCEGLKDVIIPSSVETIGDRAFCRAAKSVTLAEGIKHIGVGSFSQCKELKSVVIPSTVESIGGNAFCYCGKLTSVMFRGERPKTNGEVLGECGNLSVVHVPSNCKSWSGMKKWQGIPLVFDDPR